MFGINKKLLIALGAVVLLAVISLGAYFVFISSDKKAKVEDPNVVAQVAGENIYIKEVKERLSISGGSMFDKDLQKTMVDELVQQKIVDKELAKKSIKITEEELTAEARKIKADYDQLDPIDQKKYKDYVSLRIGKDKLLTKVGTWKEGYALFCYFDMADQTNMAKNPQKAEIRQRNEAYAKDYCAKAKARLESGQSTYEQELAKLQSDPEIGDKSWLPQTMPMGMLITKEKFQAEYFHPGYGVFNKLSSLSDEKNKYYLLTMQTKIPVDQTSELTKDSKFKEQDSMMMIVYIKDANKGETTNFEKWLKDKYNEYKVKTYIERVKI